jgi:hypothetical protein
MLAFVARIGENHTHGILVAGCPVSLGMADRQPSVLNDMDRFCDVALAENSIYALLHRERDRLFPDEMFADLFSEKGRRSVPPSVVATVMVLQRPEGLSDREAVERYSFDARWRYGAGVGSYDCGGWQFRAYGAGGFPGRAGSVWRSEADLRPQRGGGRGGGSGGGQAGVGFHPAV